MKNSYIKIKAPNDITPTKAEGFGHRFIKTILTTIIPVANPDFENKIDNVSYWLIEFENEHEYPSREIGLDTSKKPIMIMPWQKNYGYWTDNNLLLKDFRAHFETVDITKEEFETNWNLFEQGI
ncbi:MAG: hypothetical protein ABIN74_13850 [Ferruginibacter sp.]